MPKKNKTIQPDEYFSAGPLQMARFGKNIVCQTNWSEGVFNEMQETLIEQFPKTLQNIDNIVSKIVELVKILPPEKLLQRAWGDMAMHHLNMSSESEANTDDVVSIRMVDYLQSVIAAIKPSDSPKKEIIEEDWQSLHCLVKELFNELNLNYHLGRTAIRRKEDPYFDMEYEEFYFKAQIYWCNIRGDRYLYHEEEYLSDVISPHSDILNKLFGITAEQLIAEIKKIQHALTRGIIEACLDLEVFRKATMDALEPLLKQQEHHTPDRMRELMAQVIKSNGWEEWQADIFGRFMGFDLFDLEKVTQIPRSLLNMPMNHFQFCIP